MLVGIDEGIDGCLWKVRVGLLSCSLSPLVLSSKTKRAANWMVFSSFCFIQITGLCLVCCVVCLLFLSWADVCPFRCGFLMVGQKEKEEKKPGQVGR